MLQIEASLSVELDGQPCAEIRTEAEQWIVVFESPAALRRALKSLASLPAALEGIAVPERLRESLHPRAVTLRVGEEVIGEIIPGEPASLLARMAGLRIPGLRLRSGRLVRALLAGG
jgi:hypothetical protein